MIKNQSTRKKRAMSLVGCHLLKFITNYYVYINNELQNIFDPNRVILSDIKKLNLNYKI